MKNNENNSFEENLNKLEEIVKKLESGDIALDDAIDKFNEGMTLANNCNKILENANETIVKALNKNGEEEEFKVVE